MLNADNNQLIKENKDSAFIYHTVCGGGRGGGGGSCHLQPSGPPPFLGGVGG